MSATTAPISYQRAGIDRRGSRWLPLARAIAIIGMLAGSIQIASSVHYTLIGTIPLRWCWAPPKATPGVTYFTNGKSTTAAEVARRIWIHRIVSEVADIGFIVGGLLICLRVGFGRALLLIGVTLLVLVQSDALVKTALVEQASRRAREFSQLPALVQSLAIVVIYGIFASVILSRRGLFDRNR